MRGEETEEGPVKGAEALAIYLPQALPPSTVMISHYKQGILRANSFVNPTRLGLSLTDKQ